MASVDAAAFVVLGPTPSNDDIRDCMVRRGYYVGGEAWEIPDEQVTAFRSEIAPGLVGFQEESPPYEVWRRRIVDETVDELLAEVSTIEMLKESVSGFDLLWVLLGMSSAFGLVMRRSRA